jgi:membrane protein required for colicin V production
MNAFDWLLLVVVLVSIVSAVAEGFFRELFSLGGVVIGLLLAGWQYWRLSPWFEPYVRSQTVAYAAGFLTIFFVVAVTFGIAGQVARWVADQAGLRWLDRLLGAAFGVVRGVVIGTALVLAATSFVPQSAWLESSELSRYFLLSAKVATWVAPSHMKEKFEDGVEQLRRRHMHEAAPAVGSAGASAGIARP